MKLPLLTPVLTVATALLISGSAITTNDTDNSGNSPSAYVSTSPSNSINPDSLREIRQQASRSGIRSATPIKVANAEWSIESGAVLVIPSGSTVFHDGLKELVPQLNKQERKTYDELVEKRVEKKRQKAAAKKAAKEAKAAAKAEVKAEAAEKKAAKEAEAEAAKAVTVSPSGIPTTSRSVPTKPSRSKAVPAGTSQGIAQEMMGSYGWGDDSQFSCLVDLWNRESNWNHLAKNSSSGAYGIPQSLPASKMASAGGDYLTNPATQIKWGLGYIQGRYGSPCNALGHSHRVGWY